MIFAPRDESEPDTFHRFEATADRRLKFGPEAYLLTDMQELETKSFRSRSGSEATETIYPELPHMPRYSRPFPKENLQVTRFTLPQYKPRKPRSGG